MSKETPAIVEKNGKITVWKCGKNAGNKPVIKSESKKPVEQDKKPGGNE